MSPPMEPDVTDAPDRLAGRFAFCLEENQLSLRDDAGPGPKTIRSVQSMNY